MTPLLEQFLAEAREFLQGIGEKLMLLESDPDSSVLMTELFRLVHTLKGNSGLFDFPELTRVLHAGEDLLDRVRNGEVSYSQNLADRLLDAMDFVSALCDEIEKTGAVAPERTSTASALTASLRSLITSVLPASTPVAEAPLNTTMTTSNVAPPWINKVPAERVDELLNRHGGGQGLYFVEYVPEEDCFFKGEDPFHQARQIPGILWADITPRESWPALLELDPYRCLLNIHVVSDADIETLQSHFRYVPDQVRIVPLTAAAINRDEVPVAVDEEALAAVLAAQLEILQLTDDVKWLSGRLKAVASTLIAAFRAANGRDVKTEVLSALEASLESGSAQPLLAWLQQQNVVAQKPKREGDAVNVSATDIEAKFGRRADDTYLGPKTLKVDQTKIDSLMNLIGEMVVAKNSLPYLAGRAEVQYGVRELAREIKAQYAVINRIAEEMQDAIMQVRMMPVSYVFQRFPRMVRDISRKLGKDVQLVMEGEDTEADKNIIESLADPLVHIVRNALDHGIEMPEVRGAAGKSPTGRLTIRASQESDRVLIEIVDDGRGIDPAIVKNKALHKGLIDQTTSERLSDQEAVNLVFAAGFSTAEAVSDLSGRGVGMDVVRSAVEKVGGSVSLTSESGRGTRIQLSLPLSMAVSNVMIIQADGQYFGVPMDVVVETVRVHGDAVHAIKHSKTTVLRGRIVPIVALSDLLALPNGPLINADGEYAMLVVRVQDEPLGILVDNFRETVDIILKPMSGILGGLSGYAGSALLGDGSVLMVLNPAELL